ncbi:MAG: putative enzyme related to lactoylglutathione lyase [Desulforhopalus sp.]|jgi:predicted enzyme related to lactoylglutathione lyase
MKKIISRQRNVPCTFLLLMTVVFIFSGLLAGCINQIKVPKVSPYDTDNQLTGKFIWYDIFTDDIAGTAKFYSELFGWSFESVPGSNRNLQNILLDGIPIGSAVGIASGLKDEADAQWLSYMSTSDVDESVRLIETNHGTIHTAPKELPDRGRVAVVRDPQGAIFALLASSAGDPPDGEMKTFSWVGSELWTSDTVSGLKFYSLVAGYEEVLVPLSCGYIYHFLNHDGQPRAGIVKIPWDDVKPNWVPYVSVKDAVAIVQKAVTLGATLILEPDSAFPDNAVAILADPSGAVFGIQQRDLNPSPKGN